MSKVFSNIFVIQKQPKKGLLASEWFVLGYILLTSVAILVAFPKFVHPLSMLHMRMSIVGIMLSLWILYRLLPSRSTMLLRVLGQLFVLTGFYSDTYEMNRMLPNLDHVFSIWEQSLFGFHPALTFCGNFPSPVLSELMNLGYVSFFPLLLTIVLYYFFHHYDEFERCAFVLIGSFFIFYFIFDLIPVAGPTFYYKVIGVDKVAKGVFPNIYGYFYCHQGCLTSPGWQDGFFYKLVHISKGIGERPTAAFPSSHVSMATICMLLLARQRNHKLILGMLPLYLLLCVSTVYIQSHYLLDAIFGLITGLVCYLLMTGVSRGIKREDA